LELLKQLIELLEKEHTALINTINDEAYSKELIEIVEKKQEVLYRIAETKKEKLLKHKELLEKIEEYSQKNMKIALNNLEFIENLFKAIFNDEETPKYTRNGELESKKEGLINKKI
jgi:hypothetical protein